MLVKGYREIDFDFLNEWPRKQKQIVTYQMLGHLLLLSLMSMLIPQIDFTYNSISS